MSDVCSIVVLRGGCFCLPGDAWSRLQTYLLVTTGGGLFLTSNGWKTGMSLHILQCKYPTEQQKRSDLKCQHCCCGEAPRMSSFQSREVSALSWWMGSVPPTATSCMHREAGVAEGDRQCQVSPKAPRVAVRGLACVLISPLNDELLGQPPSSPNLQSFTLSFRGYFS